MRLRRSCIALALALATTAVAPADTRTQNIDILVAIDRSLSMEQKIGAVERYVTDTLIDQVLIPGDFFVAVAFYGKAEVVVSQFVRTPEDRRAVKEAVNSLRGNGRFTDIGNALDVLQAQVAKYENDGRRKYVLLITDGIQEAPPGSKYWSKDGTFNHAFLQNTKTIQQKGWKVQILGIGEDTAARDLAQALEGAYGELTGPLSADAIRSQTENLLGTISVVEGSARISAIGSDGLGELTLGLKSEGYSKPVRVTLASIQATPQGASGVEALVSSPFAVDVAAEGLSVAHIPLRMPTTLPAGRTNCSLTFTFLAGESFTPTTLTLPLTVRGWVGNNPIPFAGIVVGALVVLAGLVFMAFRLARGPSQRFVVLLDGAQIGSAQGLARGGRLFLTELDGEFRLTGSRTARSIALFAVAGGRLALEFLKPDRFPKAAEPPAEARGTSLVVKASDGSKHQLEIRPDGRSPEAATGRAEAQAGVGSTVAPPRDGKAAPSGQVKALSRDRSPRGKRTPAPARRSPAPGGARRGPSRKGAATRRKEG